LAKTRAAKEESLAMIESRLGHASSMVLADYRGLDVAKVTELRRRLRAAGVEYRVCKNTLLQRAAKTAGIAGLDPWLEGPTAVAWSDADPTAGPRELAAFGRDNPELQVKGGLLGRQVIDAARVKALAELPSREVLLARTAGAFAAPMTSFASLLAAPLRGLAGALEALRKTRSEQGEAVASGD
jgi:large subunit ribosomal protein L10